MSAPQHPSDTAVSDSPVTDAAPEEGDGQPALPDADAASDDAVVEPVDDTDEADEADEADEDEDEDDEEPAKSGDDPLVREGDVAGDYLERLLDILDVDGDIDLDVEGDRASVAIVGGRLERPDRPRRGDAGGSAGADPSGGGPVHRCPEPADARRRRVPRQEAGRPHRARRGDGPAGGLRAASPSAWPP